MIRIVPYVSPMRKDRQFSRAAALREGVRHVRQDAVILFLDIDVSFSASVLLHCRSLAGVRGTRVAYYPVVFMKYPTEQSEQPLRDRGFWNSAGFGMVCLLKSSFTSAGGFGGDEEERFGGWGREDHALLANLIDANVSIMRAPDLDLIHNWHSKPCHPGNKYFKFCVASLRRSLGP
jgi:predicted glycosyltransferase involved in capsule biosynthesis